MTFGELTEKITMDEFFGWMAFFERRAEMANQDNKNLVGKSEEDLLKGFGF